MGKLRIHNLQNCAIYSIIEDVAFEKNIKKSTFFILKKGEWILLEVTN